MQKIERISERFEEIQDKEFLSVVETAFLLSIERTTVYRYLHRDKLKGIRMDGKPLSAVQISMRCLTMPKNTNQRPDRVSKQNRSPNSIQ